MNRKRSWIRKSAGCALLLLTGWMLFSPTAQALRALPDTYRLTVGQAYALNTGVAVLSSQDERLEWKENTLRAREQVDASQDAASRLFRWDNQDWTQVSGTTD